MRRAKGIGALPVALALTVLAPVASAATPVNCNANPTTALGSAIANATPNSVLAILGMCQEDVTIASAIDWGITITNDTGNLSGAYVSSDGIIGHVTIAGPVPVAINGIVLEGTATDTGIAGTVLLERGASVTITNAQIAYGQRNGVALQESSTAEIDNVSIYSNGIAGIANASNGISAVGGSHVELGAMNSNGSINAPAGVSISQNTGNGLFVGADSRLTMSSGAVYGNLGIQIMAVGSALVTLADTFVAQSSAPPAPAAYAIEGMGTTTLTLLDGTTVEGGGYAGAVQVASSSALILVGVSLSNNLSSEPTVNASVNSSIDLSGGNQITNNASGGVAAQIDHMSGLYQALYGGSAAALAPGPWTATPNTDTITGAGISVMDSTVDLGVGLLGGNQSLVWNGTVTMSQSSTFRMSGGATINGSLTLAQGSNGYFSNANGGSGNVVTGGVTCPGTVAVSHVAAPANTVLLAPGSSTSAVTLGATPPSCPSF
ncbi:MAG TPA: right-handed parallel beta-helix repeat-containing protein [Stellaceae bacterium]|nr:right-handed parallel beta-helix repeat-containing protein [Stellaceae bacterium]